MSGYYDLTDKAIDILNRRAVKRFEDAKDEAAQNGFDELNVLEVTQSILQDMFAMIMMVDISGSDIPFTEFADEMAAAGREMHLSIHAMHEDIFNSMHRI